MIISRIFISKKTEGYFRQLYRKNEADRKMRLFGKKKLVLFAGIVLAAVFAAIPVFLAENEDLGTPVAKLSRNGYGEGGQTVDLLLRTGDGREEKVSVVISERQYSDRELAQFSRQIENVLWTGILGDNKDPENVTADLDLKKSLDGYPFEIEWRTDRPGMIGSSGAINRERLAEEDPDDKGVAVRLRATLRYGEYSEDKYSYVYLRQNSDDPEENVKTGIERSIRDIEKSDRDGEYLILPAEYEGQRITFYRTGINKGWMVLFTGIAAAFLVMTKKDESIRKVTEGRKKQMEDDHSGILNRYALYYTAGMNPRTIWTEMCRRYKESLDVSGKNRRYVYDEMLVTGKMMEEGMEELAAYDDFAQRTGSIRYRAFISLVKQTVVKGSAGLDKMLYEEMERSQTERINRARTEASEAQTKLLLPMFMMLLVVLAIVMIPAFAGLNG